jgi:tRNA (uracil-5-)-methyltransferase TRM9
MKRSIIDQIVKLNTDFYQYHAEAFSRSRLNPWEGWGQICDTIQKQFPSQKTQMISVLDLGCGNGRFLGFMANFVGEFPKFTYLGLDTCSKFLVPLEKEYQLDDHIRFQALDVITNLDKLTENYDVICAFGMYHHIPSQELRLNWVRQCLNLLTDRGILIISLWNFPLDKTLPSPIDPDDLEAGDYFLGWQDDTSHLRFAHLTNPTELTAFTISEQFTNAIKPHSTNYNTYLVLKKSENMLR